MSRFERKCFIGSAALHGLLLVTFLVSSAFLDSKPQLSAASVITILPPDTKAYGKLDGNPEPPAPAQQNPPPETKSEPPKPVEPEVQPEPVKRSEPVKVPEPKKPDPIVKDPAKSIQKKPEPAISKTVVRRTNETARLELARIAKAKEAADRKYREDLAKWNAQRGQAIAAATAAVGGVGKSLSKSTVVTSLGIDLSGGRVSGSYGERLKAMYDARWMLPSELVNDESVACVRVVVRRDGTIKSATITKGSGNPTFDRSVRRALDDVHKAESFPPELKDDERAFNWNFERKTRLG